MEAVSSQKKKKKKKTLVAFKLPAIFKIINLQDLFEIVQEK